MRNTLHRIVMLQVCTNFFHRQPIFLIAIHDFKPENTITRSWIGCYSEDLFSKIVWFQLGKEFWLLMKFESISSQLFSVCTTTTRENEFNTTFVQIETHGMLRPILNIQLCVRPNSLRSNNKFQFFGWCESMISLRFPTYFYPYKNTQHY